MVMRSTRLEFLIVTIAFVVLLLCSRPPKTGEAQTTEPMEPVAQPEVMAEKPTAPPVAIPSAPAAQPAVEDPPRQTAPAVVSLPVPDRSPGPKPRTKRMASVDARNCPGLNYPEILYGEVTVRFVWDGNRSVPRKVCVVTGPDGVTTVWSFDDPGGAIVTEIGDFPADSP
jgi:hypothetical protein